MVINNPFKGVFNNYSKGGQVKMFRDGKKMNQVPHNMIQKVDKFLSLAITDLSEAQSCVLS